MGIFFLLNATFNLNLILSENKLFFKKNDFAKCLNNKNLMVNNIVNKDDKYIKINGLNAFFL